MNWKNSMFLNLRFASRAKGLSTLPSFITLKSSYALCGASAAILKGARTSCYSHLQGDVTKNRLFALKSHSFPNPLNSEMSPLCSLKGYNKESVLALASASSISCSISEGNRTGDRTGAKKVHSAALHRRCYAALRRRCYAASSNSPLLPSPTEMEQQVRAERSRDVILYKMEKEEIDASLSKPIFFNQCFDKGRLKNFVLWFLLNYGESKTVQLVEQLKNVGFQYASKAGISLGIDDLKIPPKKIDLIYEAEKLTQGAVKKYASGEITGVERFQSIIDIWHRTSEFLKQEVINYFEATDVLNPVYMMAFSGARGNISQVRQLVGMRGLMADPQGQIIDFPIRSNFREGLTLTEYIISSYGARKGIVDTALRTADAGYLTRRLVDVAQHVIISNLDCGTKRGIYLKNMKEGNKTIHSLSQRIVGRILARDLFKDSDSPNPIKIASRNDEVTLDLAFEIGKYFSKVFVRSALTCETSKQICQLCYGWSLAQGNLVSIGEAVGVVAAQSIGEPGTQLTMRTFHTGGVFSGDVSDQIKAPFDGIVEYEAAIPGTLVRTPEGQIGFLTKVEGYFYVHKPITNLDSNFFSVLTNNSNKKVKEALFSESKKFKIPSLTLLYIKNGQRVYAKEVIAQISPISRKENASGTEGASARGAKAGLAEEAELTIKSECEGQFYSKDFYSYVPTVREAANDEEGKEEKTTIASAQEASESTAIDNISKSKSWSYAWILSGKIYEYKLPSLFFPKFGDFMNSKSYISQIAWKLNPSNGHNVFYDINKRTPGNILNKKHYMSTLPPLLSPCLASRTSFSDLPEPIRSPKEIVEALAKAEVEQLKSELRSTQANAPKVRSHQRCEQSTAKNTKKGIGLGSNDSFNETLMRKTQSLSLSQKNVECENVSPMQSSQILFFDLKTILYKKYGYAFQLPEKIQFFKKSQIASLNNPSLTSLLENPMPCLWQTGNKKNEIAKSNKQTQSSLRTKRVGACVVGAPSVRSVQRSSDLLVFLKSLTMLNTSNTHNELPYFLQWFPSQNQTLTGGYILLEMNPTMDSIISQKSHFQHKFNTSFFRPLQRQLPLQNTFKDKNVNNNFYTRVTIPTFTRVGPKVVKKLRSSSTPLHFYDSYAKRGRCIVSSISSVRRISKGDSTAPPLPAPKASPKAQAQERRDRTNGSSVFKTQRFFNTDYLRADRRRRRQGNETVSLKFLSTLIKTNLKKRKMHFSSSLFTSPTAKTLSQFQKRKPPVTSLLHYLEGQNREVKKTEALESRVLWVSSSFFKINLSSLKSCKTALLFNTSKDSPLFYLTQSFENSHFVNKQNMLLTPTQRAATPLPSEQEISNQKDQDVQETKNTNFELSQKQSSIKKLNFFFVNKKMPARLRRSTVCTKGASADTASPQPSPSAQALARESPSEIRSVRAAASPYLLFLQTNRQGNVRRSGFQKSNFNSLSGGSANKHIQNRFETEGALLKLKVSNFLTSYSTLSTPSSSHISASSHLVQSPKRLKSQELVKNKTICTEGTKSINAKKRKLLCFKQLELANLTTYCRFANNSFSSLPSFTSLQFEEVLPKNETSKLEVKSQKHINLPSVRASRPIKAKKRIYFGTFGSFTTLIDNSFNDRTIRFLPSPLEMEEPSKQLLFSPGKTKKVHSASRAEGAGYSISEGDRRGYGEAAAVAMRSLFMNSFIYTKESNFFVSNSFEKEYKIYQTIQNKANFYSFMNERLFQLTPCLQIHYISNHTSKSIKENVLNAFPTSIEKGKTIKARSISKKKELRRAKFVKKKGKISKSLVFSPSAYGALKKGWVVIPASSTILGLWKLHKKRINPGQVLMDKLIFNMPILTECFVFNDIFNIEKISLPKSFSFGSSALVTNTKEQRLSQIAEDVNGLYWVKNKKSRYFMSSPSSNKKELRSLLLLKNQEFLKEQDQGKEDGGFFESIKAQTESNSLIPNNVKIGLFIQPVEEYTKMSNFELKNYVYESNSNTLKNLCKNIDSFEKSKIVRFGCFASRTAGLKVSKDSNRSKKRSILKAIKKKSISSRLSKLRACEAKAIQSRVNQSFDSLLNWQKYKSNLYNKQNRTLQPLAKFTKKDFSVFSVALWTERQKVLFEKYLTSLRNFNKASVRLRRSTRTSNLPRRFETRISKGDPIRSPLEIEDGATAKAAGATASVSSPLETTPQPYGATTKVAGAESAISSLKTKKSQAKKAKKGTNTTKKPGMRSGLKSNFSKKRFNPQKFSQKPLYVVSRKPLNLSPFLISFDNFSLLHENQRLRNLSEEIKTKKASLIKPVRYQKVSFKQTFTDPILNGSKKDISYLDFQNNAICDRFNGSPKSSGSSISLGDRIAEERNNSLSKNKEGSALRFRLRLARGAALALKKKKPAISNTSIFLKNEKSPTFSTNGATPTATKAESAKSVKKTVQKWNFGKNPNIKGSSTKNNPNNPNKGFFNLSLSYQTYMISYPPISKFDSLLDPLLNHNLNLILSFYLNKTVSCSISAFTRSDRTRTFGASAYGASADTSRSGASAEEMREAGSVDRRATAGVNVSTYATGATDAAGALLLDFYRNLRRAPQEILKNQSSLQKGKKQQTTKSSQHATLASPSVKRTRLANSFYFNIKNLIRNVFESPCFSYNLTYPIDKFSLYKKAKTSVALRTTGGKMQNTQFFYSFSNNSLSGNREEIQSNKPFAQTNYASPFIGEVVYINKNLLNFPSIKKGVQRVQKPKVFETVQPWKTESFVTYPSVIQDKKTQLKNRVLFESQLENGKNSRFSAKSKTVDSLSFEKETPLSYSCMFLTQKDLISFYFPSNNFKQSVKRNYGQNYQINDILIKFWNMTENPDSETILKQLESFVKTTSKEQTLGNALTTMLSKRDNFEIKMEKFGAGLPFFSASFLSNQKAVASAKNVQAVEGAEDFDKKSRNLDNKRHYTSLLGDFIMYGDTINNKKSAFAQGEELLASSIPSLLAPAAPSSLTPTVQAQSPEGATQQRDRTKSAEALGESLVAICANGQIIHYNNKKITLRRGQPIYISPKSILHKNDGEFIDSKTPVITLTYQKLKTGDIIQGIPKVEQFLEARTTKRGRLFRDSLPSLLKALFNRYKSKLSLELAVRQSIYKIQQIIVDGVLRVYKSQGVTIADKHLEVIVKQMTSKVRIIDGSQTGFFPGEIVDLRFIEKINTFLIKKITYEPLVLGITRASLEVDSFLSASSFQQTTRILSDAAIYRKRDFLKGLKESVIIGNLIPAGTGYLVNQDDIYSQIYDSQKT